MGVVIVMALTGIIVSSFRYLEGSTIKKLSEEDMYSENIEKALLMMRRHQKSMLGEEAKSEWSTLVDRINVVSDKLDEISKIGEPEGQGQAVLQQIKDQIIEGINPEFFERLNEKMKSEYRADTRMRTAVIQSEFEILRRRLKQMIVELNKRANYNLIIGVVITLSAIGMIVFFIYSNPYLIETLPTEEKAWYLVPRMSLAVFLEVFAFFFLRLYKLNLTDVKYFQNELTNV